MDALTKGANERMTTAIKQKDMINIDIAHQFPHQLQEVAASKQQNAHKELHKLNGKKRKITESLQKYGKKKREF